ncbi:U4/U6.U5 small nuclear ribonucleoprotein 27 kDa protein-like protein, partial [Dinothrombium tinctorium]
GATRESRWAEVGRVRIRHLVAHNARGQITARRPPIATVAGIEAEAFRANVAITTVRRTIGKRSALETIVAKVRQTALVARADNVRDHRIDIVRIGRIHREDGEELVLIPGPDRNSKGGAVPKFLLERPEITDKDLEGKSEEEQQMMKMMGFATFDTTKGKHVPGNDVHAVHVIHKRKYRQYMNRKGGFNRPLDFVA